MELEFTDITYTVSSWKFRGKISKTTQQILKSISGKFCPGQLIAIMGASGSGKTSLLNALSAYRLTGVDGKFSVGGMERNVRKFHKYCCYISQDDLHQPLMTVREIMNLVASLKLPSSSSKEFKNNVMNEILNNLRMDKNSEKKIEHLSGGEKKRLSIALELIKNPPIFFLDEPTSGLDQVTSSECIDLLRDLANQGKTVIITIHQPSASIFERLDNVYVMAEGKCVYQGEPLALVPFLLETGFQCPVHYNPADYVIEVTENHENIEKLCDLMKNGKVTRFHQNNEQSLNTENDSNKSQVLSKNSTSTSHIRKHSLDSNIDYATNYYIQFKVLLFRMILQIRRNRLGMLIQILHHFICGIGFGLCFYQTGNDGTLVISCVKLCFAIVVFLTYTQAMVPALVYPIEVKLVKKEYFNRWYGLPPYFAALTIAKLPLLIFLNTIYCTFVYFLAGFPNEFYRFVLFCTICNIVTFTAEGFGYFLGSIFKITNACIIGPMAVAPMFGLGIYGFDFPKLISFPMKIAMRTSYVRSGFVGITIINFGYENRHLNCNEDICYFGTSHKVLEFLGFDETNLWIEMLNILVIAMIFRMILYMALVRRFAWK